METVIARTNKGHRVWLQGLTAKGFTGRFTVEFCNSAILVQFHDKGKRKLTEAKGGIVDIEGKRVSQWAQGSDTARVLFEADTGRILIERL